MPPEYAGHQRQCHFALKWKCLLTALDLQKSAEDLGSNLTDLSHAAQQDTSLLRYLTPLSPL